jgi:hypothetical protein
MTGLPLPEKTEGLGLNPLPFQSSSGWEEVNQGKAGQERAL